MTVPSFYEAREIVTRIGTHAAHPLDEMRLHAFVDWTAEELAKRGPVHVGVDLADGPDATFVVTVERGRAVACEQLPTRREILEAYVGTRDETDPPAGHPCSTDEGTKDFVLRVLDLALIGLAIRHSGMTPNELEADFRDSRADVDAMADGPERQTLRPLLEAFARGISGVDSVTFRL